MYGHTEDLYLLRRRHLREMGEPIRDSLALSNLLLCDESESSLNEDNETIIAERSEQQNPQFDDDEDYVAELVLQENQRFETQPTKTTSSFDRLIAIDWILTVSNQSLTHTHTKQTNKQKVEIFFSLMKL